MNAHYSDTDRGYKSHDPERQANSPSYWRGRTDGRWDRWRIDHDQEPVGPQETGWMYKAGYNEGLG